MPITRRKSRVDKKVGNDKKKRKFSYHYNHLKRKVEELDDRRNMVQRLMVRCLALISSTISGFGFKLRDGGRDRDMVLGFIDKSFDLILEHFEQKLRNGKEIE